MTSPKPQADRHDDLPISIRPERGLRKWLIGFAERTGLSRNAVVSAALSEYRDRHDPESKHDPESEQ